MKLSKQELKQRISDAITDNDDLVISLLEDVEDSMVENSESVMDETKMKEFEELKWKYDDLKAKYKERFLKGDDKPDEDAEDDEELKEEEVIDVKEI
jgi:hypothetical protein